MREVERLLPGGAGLPSAAELGLPDATGDDLLAIVAAYYGHPAVRAALGYPGPRAIALPRLPDARDAELGPMLDRVRARGPIYRDPDVHRGDQAPEAHGGQAPSTTS